MEAYEKELEQRLGEVLHYLWDPVGIVDAYAPQTRDEYDTYVPEICKALSENKSLNEIVALLNKFEIEKMQLSPRIDHNHKIAGAIWDWSRYLKEKYTIR